MTIAVECVVRGPDVLGECTIWCDRDQILWWVDIRAPALKSFNPASGELNALMLPEKRSAVLASPDLAIGWLQG